MTRLLIRLALVLLSVAGAALAQSYSTTKPGDILDQFQASRVLWTTGIWQHANRLFGTLAVIEFAWSAAVMVLEKTDLQSWTSALIRKIMWIGAFYALLVNGSTWIPAIIESFEILGSTAAGLGAPLSPSKIFAQGLSIAGGLLDAASTSAFFTNPGSSFALAFAALLIVISYAVITINFIMTMVESYIVVSVGYVFLGFGGSRWTAPYVERYLALAVGVGVRILVLYCLIAGGLGLGVGWMTEAQGVGNSANPAMSALDIMAASLIYMTLCWQVPKLCSSVLGGSPALTGGDLIGMGTGVAIAGAAAASGVYALGARATSGLTAVGNALSGQATGASELSAVSQRSSAPPPPSSPAAGGTSANRTQPDPPAPPRNGGGAGATSEMRRVGRALPSDVAPPASPPRMPIDHED